MKNKSKTKQITYTLVVTVVALVGLLILTRGITYAKYVSNSVLNIDLLCSLVKHNLICHIPTLIIIYNLS